MKGAVKHAVRELETVIGADLALTRVALPLTGRRIVSREKVQKPGAVYRTIAEMIAGLTHSNGKAVRLFEDVEDLFMKVLANPSSPGARQARKAMEALDTEWGTLRAELETVLVKRSQIEGIEANEARKGAAAVLKRLDDHFNGRYGFITYGSQLPFESPEQFERLMRQELSKSKTSPESIAELSGSARALKFLEAPPLPPTKPSGRGRELFKELHQPEGKGGKAARGKPATKGQKAPKPAGLRPPAVEQARAVSKLAMHHREGDVLYDDLIDVVDQRVAARPAGSSRASTDEKFVNDVVNHVQGRMGEALALKHPRFIAEVWEPARRTAESVRDELNARLAAGVPRWRTEVITEPTWATLESGRGGEFIDSGIWLVREGPDGNVAMPVFMLEVKSGELFGSITQQVMDKMRARGIVDLPSTGRRYRMTLPPKVALERALASTRTISDKRLLGMLEEGKISEYAALEVGERLLTFKIPMRRDEIRAAAYAVVLARLRQVEGALK